jgi:hypothetical protein
MKLWAIVLLLPALAAPQSRYTRGRWDYADDESIRRSFTLSGAAPHRLEVDNINGYIHVTAAAGAAIEVTVAKHIDAESTETLARAKREVTLDMSQHDNSVRLYPDGPFRHRGNSDRDGYRVAFDYDIQVPPDTELDLKTINGGDIVVKHTTGDYFIHGLNGAIDMQDVAGSGTVRTLNGKVNITFARNPARASEFRTLNGAIDVYFQPGLNAGLQLKTLNGGVWTDFDVTVGGQGSALSRLDRRGMEARVGQGGPLLAFNTLNGSIRLHTKSIQVGTKEK